MRSRNKYNAKRTARAGRTFDSASEASYYDLLRLRQAAGEIKMFLEQVPFRLPGGSKLVLDFVIFETGPDDICLVRFVDVKSKITAAKESFRVKKREVEALFGIVIEVVDRYDREVS